MVIIGTSNFPQAIDPAFLSRLDLTIEIALPDDATTLAILEDVLSEVGTDIEADEMQRAAKALEGSSGRDIRKVVFEALVSRDATIAIEAPLQDHELWTAIEARRAATDIGGS